MSLTSKIAAGVLAAGIITAGGAGAAFAKETTPVKSVSSTADATVVTKEQVAAAKAAWDKARADATKSEKAAQLADKAEEKAAQTKIKLAKTKAAKKAAEANLKAVKTGNDKAFKALKAANDKKVNTAKAEYLRLATAFGKQVSAPKAPEVEVEHGVETETEHGAETETHKSSGHL